MKRTHKEWKRFRGMFYFVSNPPDRKLTPVGQRSIRVYFGKDKFIELQAVNGQLNLWCCCPFEVRRGASNSFSIVPPTLTGEVSHYYNPETKPEEQSVSKGYTPAIPKKEKHTGYFSHLIR